MRWLSNRRMRDASNRSLPRLIGEFGTSPATAILALAMGHACYPTAAYGDDGMQDEIVHQLKQFSRRPCEAKTARQFVKAWLDMGTLSTAAAFSGIWGLEPAPFLDKFFEQFDSGATD